MQSQRENIIRNYFEPKRPVDVVDLYDWLSPDVTICEPEGLPWSGQYHGLGGVGDYMTKVTRHVISEIQLEEIYSCGEQVVTIGRSVGRVVANHRHFNIRLMQIFTFNESDKIVKVEFLADLPAFQRVLKPVSPEGRPESENMPRQT